MKRILELTIITLIFTSSLKAATTYNISSNTNWSTSFPSYCGSCTINIASGITLSLNNSSMCDNCTITGGTIKITSGFTFQSTSISNTSIAATSSFTLDNTNSFNNVTAVISGSSSFTSNGALTMTSSSFTFQNTASFTSNSQLNLNASHLYFNDNSHFVSNSSTVNIKNGSTIVAGDGSKSSKAYLVFYGQLNVVDASSMLIISNVNNYYLSWNTYTSATNGSSYATTNNNKNCGGAGQNACSQANYYGGAVLSSSGPLPITVLATTIADFKGSESDQHSVRLSWTLSDASGGENFQIERSNDAEHFTPLVAMSASRSDSNYSYTDESPAAGENDYRIKLTGADGKIVYSKIISVRTSVTGSLRIFPNPCTNGNIQIQFPSVQSAMIRVFTIDGKLLYMNSLTGQSHYAVNITGAGNTRLMVVQIVTKEKSSTFNLLNTGM